MSTYYSFRLAFGYEISLEQVIDRYGLEVSETSHMEDRYDVRTGKKVGSEKIIDHEAGTIIQIGGAEYGLHMLEEISEALEEELDGVWHLVSEGDDNNDISFVVTPHTNVKSHDHMIEYDNADGKGGYDIIDLARAMPKILKFGKALQAVGFKLEKPIVRIIGGFG